MDERLDLSIEIRTQTLTPRGSEPAAVGTGGAAEADAGHPDPGAEQEYIPVPGRSPLPPIRRKRRRASRRGGRGGPRKPPLSIEQILRWADEHQRRTGDWPRWDSGAIPGTNGEAWGSVNQALRVGVRGLAGGSSLAMLLQEARGRRNRKRLPPFTEAQILEWAVSHRERTGDWPSSTSGEIVDAPGESWNAVQCSLRNGIRGQPGGSSLGKLLEEHFGVECGRLTRALTEAQILEWADKHRRRTGEWPAAASGALFEAPEQNWSAINQALKQGLRGLPGGLSLAKLLARDRGVRNRMNLPPLSEAQVLDWADRHHARTGHWPRKRSGPIPEAPDETWLRVDAALHSGGRSLQGGSSLADLLLKTRGVLHHLARPHLTEAQILLWIDSYRARHDRWPTLASGQVDEAPDERWANIDHLLRAGLRGLPGGSSVALLLATHRGVRVSIGIPRLTEQQILEWADAYYARHGEYPRESSGPVDGADGEIWRALSDAIRLGSRGLPGGSSLARLLSEHRGAPRVIRFYRRCVLKGNYFHKLEATGCR